MTDYLNKATKGIFSVPMSIFDGSQTKLRSVMAEEVDTTFESFEYELNEYGFRYKEPTKSDVLLATGCSITFGQGMPSELIYPQLVANNLSMDLVNVSLPGTGPDIQITNALWAINKYNPKIVIFYMSDVTRRYVADEYGFRNVSPHWENDVFESAIEKKIFITMEERYKMNRYLQVAWSMYPLIQLCNSKNIKLYFKCWAGEADAMLRRFDFFSDTYELPNIKKDDYARDKLHPGIKCHSEFAERILNVIKV